MTAREQRMKTFTEKAARPEDILKTFPKPWGESTDDGEKFRLNENGLDAMFAILMAHPYSTDKDGLFASMNANDPKGCWRTLAKSADRFIEEHQEHSCIPPLKPEHLCLLMSLFVIECEFQAGMRNEDGDFIQ